MSSIRLNPKDGSITSRTRSPNAHTLVACITDLHGNAGVQRHEARIIDVLVGKHGFTHIFVEGASGQGDLELLAELTPATRRAFTTGLLGKAYLTGPELAGVQNVTCDFDLFGVDDADLYRNNWEPAERAALIRNEVSAGATTFKARVLESFLPFVSREMADLFSLWRQAGTALLPAEEREFLFKFSALALIYSVAIPPAIRARMRKRGVLQPEGESSRRSDRYEVMEEADETWSADLTPVFDDLARGVFETADPDRREFDRRFWFLLRTIDMVGSAFQLQLTRDAAQRFFGFDAKDLRARVGEAVGWLNGHIDAGYPACVMPTGFDRILDQWEIPREFYRMAMERSEKMLQNLASEIMRHKLEKVIFYSGGFHTDHVVRNLAKRYGMASVVITPSVDKLDDTAYQARLLEDVVDNGNPTLPSVSFSDRIMVAAERIVSPFLQAVEQRRRKSATRTMLSLIPISGHEVILDVGATRSDVFTEVSKHLKSGFVVAIDRFNLYMGGNLIDYQDPEIVKQRASIEGNPMYIEIANMSPIYMNVRDSTFDVIFASSFERVARTNDKRKAIGEFVRTLKPGGFVVLFDAHSQNVSARLLCESKAVDVYKVRRRIGGPVVLLARKGAPIDDISDLSRMAVQHAEHTESGVSWH